MRIDRFIFSLWIGLVAAATAADTPVPATRSLSLADCVQMALEHNLDVQIERINPEIARYNISLAYADYDPKFNVSGTTSYSKSPNRFIPTIQTNILGSTSDNNTYNAGLGGSLPMGMTYNLGGYLADSMVRPQYGAFGSSSAGASLTLTQPLLKNFWINPTRMNILVNKKSLKIKDLNLHLVVMQTVTRVEQAYYDLVAARENVRVQEMALELAKRLSAENKKRVEVGAMAPLEEKQAESQAATTRAALLAAQSALNLQQNNLKSLINENFSSWPNVMLEPTEPLTAVVQVFSLQDSWQKGMTMRPELLQARTQLESQDIILKYSRNQLFPELDLTGSYGYNGAEAYSRDVSRALDQVGEGSNPNYSFGVAMSIPLSNRAARENYKISKAQKKQLLLQLKKMEQTIMVQIDNDVKQAQTSFDRVDATKQARLYAEDALKAEEKKLINGKSTSFVVLTMQSNLTNARSIEIGALTDYNKTLAQLALDEGSTLERGGLNIQLK